MKGVLAYSTISHLGLITLLLGMNSRLALVAAVFHMMNHATFKASLFMAAGIIDHETGTRDLRRLSGLRRCMPVTAVLTTVAAGAMAGVPLLNGFLSKEMFFAESIEAGGRSGLDLTLPALATLAGVFSVAYSLRFIHQVFFGPLSTDLPRAPREPTRGMLLPAAILVLACLLVGILPAVTVGPFLATAAQSILGADLPPYRLAVWHGVTVPLVMSALALTGGAALYVTLYRRQRAMAPTPLLSRVNARRVFDVLNVLAIRGAARLSRLLMSWRTQPQLLLIVCVALVAGALPIAIKGWTRGPASLTPPDPVFVLLWLLGAVCAVGTASLAKFHRLAALVMAGGAGLAVTLTFAWFSAPDLALTQLSVEIVTLVLILLGLRWLPPRLPHLGPDRRALVARARRARDLTVAVLAGIGVTLLVFAVLTRPPAGELSSFFLANAYELAGGRNVVNVMLVDFRGLDTMGEITVVGIVAIIVYALLRRFRPAPESIGLPAAQVRAGAEQLAIASLRDPLPRGDLRIPAVLARLLLPMAGLVAVYFLLRGHHAPGGGFVGGLVMATAVIVQYMVSGTMWVEARLRVHPLVWIGLGLLAAVTAGLIAWTAGLPFLSSRTLAFSLPVIGAMHLSTTLLFDLGVFMVVVGATLLMLVALAHQSLRSPRKTVTPVSPDSEDSRVLGAGAA
jgi:multicomponent K+:H+ antiporter subunit A